MTAEILMFADFQRVHGKAAPMAPQTRAVAAPLPVEENPFASATRACRALAAGTNRIKAAAQELKQASMELRAIARDADEACLGSASHDCPIIDEGRC